MRRTKRRPLARPSIRLALASTFAFAAAGCSPIAVPGPDGDHTYSAPWHGDYEGAGCFSNPAYLIADLDVRVTVRIADVGDNRIRIALHISPQTVAYSPILRVDGQLTRLHQAEIVTLNEVIYHHASLVRTDDGGISGTLWATSLADGLYWKCTIEANPVPRA